MGALRAAELDRFGMVGVGAIYRGYRDGRLVGDDEVALIHATERLDWAPLAVPMVEVRATLLAACRAKLTSPAEARRIRSLCHDMHFDARDWPAMERQCVAEGLIDRATFLRIAAMHVQLKRLDALECLAAALRPATHRVPGPPPQTCFIVGLAKAVSSGGSAPTPDRPRRRGARPHRPETDDGA